MKSRDFGLAMLIGGLMVFGGASGASAVPLLTGDTVHLRFTDFVNFDDNTQDVVVGPGDEAGFFGNYTIDISDTSVTLRLFGGGYCGTSCTGTAATLIISGMDFSPASAITGVSLTDGGLFAFNPTFTNNSVSFQMQDVPVNGGTFATLDFTAGAAAVPEPSTLALFGAGLIGLGALRRRRNKRQNA